MKLRVKEIWRVKSARIGMTDRDMLAIDILMQSGSSHQAYQSILDGWDEERGERVVTAFAAQALVDALRFFGVEEISEAKGQAVFVERDSAGYGEYIRSLRRLPCDGGAVLDFSALLSQMRMDGRVRR